MEIYDIVLTVQNYSTERSDCMCEILSVYKMWNYHITT